jgi:hypothetical protein
MLDVQENIAKVQSATGKLRRDLAAGAVREYFAVLDPIHAPRGADFEAAQTRAYAVLKQGLLSADSIALIDGQVSPDPSGRKDRSPGLDEDSVSLLALSFDGLSRPLRIPGPAGAAETKPFTLALAGAAGALTGMVALAPLMRAAFDMRDLGLVLGGPLGAFLIVLLVYRLARVRFLTRMLPWFFVRPKTLRGTVRSEHEKAVRAAVEQWLEWAVSILAVLCLYRSGRPQLQTDRDKALRKMSRLVYALHRTPAESLPVVAHELLQEAKNSGFEGLEGQPAFLDAGHEEKETLTWRPDLSSKYETFGHITEGDQVMVERPAVILAGEVVQRGLVRKIRDRK